MNQIVRRPANTPLLAQGEETLPARSHRSGPITVTSQLTIGIEPRLRFSWSVSREHWQEGYTLLIFRSYSGFSHEKYPRDLSKHGQLVIETTEDGSHDEVATEGQHFITCLLHKKSLFGLCEHMSVVRFSETVPSAKVAVGRIKDQIELRELLVKHEVMELEHEAKVNEAELRRRRSNQELHDSGNQEKRKPSSRGGSLVEDELAGIDAMVEALIAKRNKIAELLGDARFRKLSKREQRAVLKRVSERLDPSEISARRDVKGT